MAGSVLFLPISGFDSPLKKFDFPMGSTLFAGKSDGRECPLFAYFGVRLSIEKVRLSNGVNPLRR
nr:MAG TPA: hypothetical protein [Caudoviricetes sp.]